MFQMIEDVDFGIGSKRRVLFLTNAQADLISNSHGASKLIDAFEQPKPKLIINLLPSPGFLGW